MYTYIYIMYIYDVYSMLHHIYIYIYVSYYDTLRYLREALHDPHEVRVALLVGVQVGEPLQEAGALAYIYIYIYTCMCMYVCMYIYIYIYIMHTYMCYTHDMIWYNIIQYNTI